MRVMTIALLATMTGCGAAAETRADDAGDADAPADAAQVWIDVRLTGPYGGECDSGPTCASWVDR